jgi:hypothetical protein
LEKNGASTVKSATHLIDEICNLRADSFSNLLWKGWMPLKMDVFLWLMLQGSLSTRGFLAYKHITHHNDALCPLILCIWNWINSSFVMKPGGFGPVSWDGLFTRVICWIQLTLSHGNGIVWWLVESFSEGYFHVVCSNFLEYLNSPE